MHLRNDQEKNCMTFGLYFYAFLKVLWSLSSHSLAFTKDFVFVSESMGELFGCLGTDLSFMVHKRSLSLSLLCTISYHCRQSKRIVLFSFSKMIKLSSTTSLKPDFFVNMFTCFFLLVSFCLQCFNSSWSAEELSARNVCFSFKSFS